MSVSVADELTFDRIMETLPELDRASVMRVLKSRGFDQHRYTSWDIDAAYERGVNAGRASAKKDAA